VRKLGAAFVIILDFATMTSDKPTGLPVSAIRRKPEMITKAVTSSRTPKAAADFDA
jgi:hypothetical protein